MSERRAGAGEQASASGGQGAVLRAIGLLSAAQILTMLLNLAALVHIARVVGEVSFGVLQWGVVFSSYALITAEWGLCILGVREVARLPVRAPGAVRSYAASHLGLLMVLGGAVMLAGVLLLPAFPMYRVDPVIMLVYLATIVPFALSLDWIGIGLERLGAVSLVKTLRSLLYAAAVLLWLTACDGFAGVTAARWVPIFYGAAWLLTAALMGWYVRGWLGGWVWPRWGPVAEWRRRLSVTAPLGAGTLVLRILLNIDLMLLGILATPAVVGNYAAAAKIVFVLIIAVEVVWKALLPRLSRAWQESAARCRRLFGFYLGLAILAALPVAVGGALVGGALMDLLYGGRFSEAGTICRILSVSYVAMALGQFLGNGLIATDRQARYFPPLILAAVVAVAGVCGLTASAGGSGAAFGMLAAHGMFLASTALAGRDLLTGVLWRPLGSAAAGCLAMGAWLVCAASWPLLPRLAAAAAVYLLAAGAGAAGWLRREIGNLG